MTSAIEHEVPPPRHPERVFLFSGHMIDAPGRATPRFPPAAVPIARHAIEGTLGSLDANASDLAIASGACGGDLLFAQACLKRGLPLLMYLPFSEPEFLERCVVYAGDCWRAAFIRVKCDPNTTTVLVTDNAGTSSADNAFERSNLQILQAAYSFGVERTHFVCLWNGEYGDGPGGTRHFVQEVERGMGQVHWLDTRKLWRI